MEGVYEASRRVIVVSSLRPAGRQAFTCAHEVGHDVHGDGPQFDELVDDRTAERRQELTEFRADAFAGELLMPKLAVIRGFSERSADPLTCSPEVFYAVACWLGVGYTSLIHHACQVLRLIGPARAEGLFRVRLPQLRQEILGRPFSGHLVMVDEHWNGRPVDVQVGDLIALPKSAVVEGTCIHPLRGAPRFTVAEAIHAGHGSSAANDWTSPVRVSRRAYVGRARYRFEEEVAESDG
jgi:hypothetical protein